MMEGPEGTTEISRWRKPPPESAPQTSEPRMGRLKLSEVNSRFYRPSGAPTGDFCTGLGRAASKALSYLLTVN